MLENCIYVLIFYLCNGHVLMKLTTYDMPVYKLFYLTLKIENK